MSRTYHSYNMTKEYFLRIYQDYLSSGLSKQQYCLENNYGRSSFYNWEKQWVKEFKKENLSESNSELTRLIPITILPEEKTPSLVLKNNAASTRSITRELRSKIEISLPSGAQIKFSGEIDRDLLMSILSKL